MEIIKTYPGDEKFHLVAELKKTIYSPEILAKNLDHGYNLEFLKAVYVLIDQEKPLATAAIYKNPDLNYEGYDCGTLGNYECIDDPEISKMLLNHAIIQAKVYGITYLIGPMNGTIWDQYGFAEQSNAETFMFEPHNPDYYKDHFMNVGFSPITEYVSNIDQNMDYDNEFIQKREQQLEEMGVVIRPINMDDYETELNRIFEFAKEAFRNSFLFTPISWEEFKQKFFNMKNVADPAHVMLAEYKNQIVGFVFNVKDKVDKNIHALVIKGLAASQKLPFRGLGQILVKKTAEIAKKENYKAVIHAIMNTKNSVVNLSQKNFGHIFNKYKLYGMEIYRLGLEV